MATLKDVAKEAGVSIATVSHYLNNTRYVSPQLVDDIKQAIQKTGYQVKTNHQDNEYKVGRQSEIAIVIPGFENTFFPKVTEQIAEKFYEMGYQSTIYVHHNDDLKEASIITNLLQNKRLAGIIIVPSSRDEKQFNRILQRKTPLIFLNKKVDFPNAHLIVNDKGAAIYKACSHLIKAGHEDIALLLEEENCPNSKVVMTGYKKAFLENGLEFKEELIINHNNHNQNYLETAIKKSFSLSKPTAFLTSNNQLTITLIKTLSELGVNIPGDVSVIGYSDEEWAEIITPPLTIIKHNIVEIAQQTVDLFKKLLDNKNDSEKIQEIPMKLAVNRSTQVIGKGPFGERPVSPEKLTFSTDDAELLKNGNFKVAISFHYAGTAWARLYENGIRNILERYGVSVISITDAHFDPKLQITQLEAIQMLQPDAVIAIPVDDKETANQFKKISKNTKLIFMSHVPAGMSEADYSACVTVNERENGHNIATLLGNHYRNKDDVKIGFIGHGASFYGTQLRDAVANEVIRAEYPNIKIVDEQYFSKIENSYELCKKMITEHPNIKALYISWDQPALHAIKALKELKRDDVDIFTFDLDSDIATYLAKNEIVKGLSSQRPYEQGIAVGLATAKALINKDKHKYIAVQPLTIQVNNLLKSWKDIMLEPAPKEIEEIIQNKLK